jgi:hypothetical protein
MVNNIALFLVVQRGTLKNSDYDNEVLALCYVYIVSNLIIDVKLSYCDTRPSRQPSARAIKGGRVSKTTEKSTCITSLPINTTKIRLFTNMHCW